MNALSSPYVGSLLNILGGMGFEIRKDMPESEIDEARLLDLKYQIPLEQMTALLNRAAEILDKPNIGLELGQRFRVHTFTKTSSVLAHVETIAQAVEINTTYEPLVHTVGTSRLERREDGAYMLFEATNLDAEKHRHFLNLLVAGYAVTTHWLAWSFDGGIEKAGFQHSPPKDVERFKSIFQCPVDFDNKENFIKFSSDIVDITLPSYSPEKLLATRKRLDLILAKVLKTSRVKDGASLEIMRALEVNALSEANVAKAMGMSLRSFTRVLKAEGTTFRQTVEMTRRELCLTHMRAGYNLTEISQMLGYSDQPAFTKAFKRWHGIPPSKYQIKPLEW